jgi:methylated-DNA-protein-cysteine methyltransferase-like protein
MTPPAESFFEAVYDLARRIPRGRVTTYGTLALALGRPRGARQVGWAMAVCDDDVPAHRVVNASGALSGDEHRALVRRALLQDEGVGFDARGRVRLDQHFWEPD